MTRLRKTDMPGKDLRVTLEAICEQGLPALFDRSGEAPLELCVEIGFGRGEFLLQLAARAPLVAHLGVELSERRVFKFARRIAPAAPQNLLLLQASGEQALEHAIGEQTVGAFWVNFPDPWPKKRHHKKRLLQAPVVRMMARRLRVGGALHVATDHAGYAQQISAVLAAEPMLQNLNSPEPFVREVPGRPITAYEKMWREEGRPLYFWCYGRRP